MAARLLVLATLALGGCSLIVDPEPGEACTSDDQCAGTSQFAGFPATCRKFFCNEGTCQEYAAGDEVCDGHDNDCDGVIDEPSEVSSEPWRPSNVALEEVTTSDAIRYGSESGTISATWTDGSAEARRATLPVEGPGGVETIGFRLTRQDESPRNLALDDGCRWGTAAGMVGGLDCDIQQITVAPTHPDRELALFAAISDEGCGAGRLQIGYAGTGEEAGIILRTPARGTTPLVEGVDVSGNRCTGASRPSCSGSGPGCGATRVALDAIPSEISSAVRERRAAQAAVAWIGDSLDRPECGGAAAPVEFVVAHLLRAVEGSTPYFWVTASGESRPETLGETSGGGAPAVSAWAGRGWLVGYGGTSGNIELWWVPSQDAPPTAESGAPAPAVAGAVRLGDVSANGADHVVMAPGPNDDDPVGVAWVEGCGSASARLRFQPIELSLTGEDPTDIVPHGSPAELDTGSIGSIGAAYSVAGMLVAGATRGDGPVAADATGGWTLMWVRDGALFGARVSEHDGQALEPATSISTAADAPFVSESGRFAFRDSVAGTLRTGAAQCRL